MAAILDFSIYQNCSRVTAPHPSGYHHRGIEHAYSEDKTASNKQGLPPCVDNYS